MDDESLQCPTSFFSSCSSSFLCDDNDILYMQLSQPPSPPPLKKLAFFPIFPLRYKKIYKRKMMKPTRIAAKMANHIHIAPGTQNA